MTAIAAAPARAFPDIDLGLSGPRAATRVVAAMSGGVDSTVAAALLKRAGYDVVGVTLQLYDHGAAVNKPGACCAGQDIHDARRAADALGFPHYVLDYESRFREEVMEDFADTYLAGATPIPCVKCNQTVKFRDLLALARDLGAECLVTGHYVQRLEGPGGPELHRAADPDRDQSYFLFATTRAQLDFLRFPLGGMRKDTVRALAAELGLTVAAKPDSQDICFVPSGSYTSVVEKLRPGARQPGAIVHVDGRVLGEHEGIIRYTVGQRRGLKVATGEPLFVVKLDAAARHVIVGPREALAVRAMNLKDVNWLGEGVPPEGRRVLARVRSTRPPVAAAVFAPAPEFLSSHPPCGEGIGEGGSTDRSSDALLRDLSFPPTPPLPHKGGGSARPSYNGAWRVVLDAPEEGVAPGQACVFYEAEGSRVLGGGWIAGTQSAWAS